MKPDKIDMKNWQWLPIAELIPYELNAKTHPEDQIRNLKQSLLDYGWIRPVTVDAGKVIIIGHGIVTAAKELGLTEAPVVIRDDLPEEEVRKLRNLDNKLGESPWDLDLLKEDLQGLDLSDYQLDWDFDLTAENEKAHFWETEAEDSEESKTFEEKFVPKKTTDDCYTPGNVYEAVKNWAVSRYNLKKREILRPFFPGGDYRNANYPKKCVVIDNPPFSILSEIVRFYMEKEIAFFLFAPRLTLFSIASGICNYLPVECSVTYENGARVATSFVTNLGEYKIEVAPELYQAVKAADDENQKTDELPNYEYPVNVITAPTTCLAKYGISLRIRPEEASFTRALDAQREENKAIFGAGFLLAEKAAAEKAAARKWQLSERELQIIKDLGTGDAC